MTSCDPPYAASTTGSLICRKGRLETSFRKEGLFSDRPSRVGSKPTPLTGTRSGASQNSRKKCFPSKPRAGPLPKTNRKQRKMETGCVCHGWDGVEGALLPTPTEQPRLGTRGGHVRSRTSAWCVRTRLPRTHMLPSRQRARACRRRSPAVLLHSKSMTLIRWKPELHFSPPE